MTTKKLNATRTLHWLNKTSRTAENLGSGSLENCSRQTIAQRYGELKDHARDLGVWDSYCAERGFSPNHDGYDLFA